jgi:hypothetical protein
MLLYPLDEKVYSMRVVGARTCEYLERVQCLRRSLMGTKRDALWWELVVRLRERSRCPARRAKALARPTHRDRRRSKRSVRRPAQQSIFVQGLHDGRAGTRDRRWLEDRHEAEERRQQRGE